MAGKLWWFSCSLIQVILLFVSPCQIITMFHSPTPASPDLAQLPCFCQFADEFILLLILRAECREFICREKIKYSYVAKPEWVLVSKIARTFAASALQLQFWEENSECSCDYQLNSCYSMSHKALSVVLSRVLENTVLSNFAGTILIFIFN